MLKPRVKRLFPALNPDRTVEATFPSLPAYDRVAISVLRHLPKELSSGVDNGGHTWRKRVRRPHHQHIDCSRSGHDRHKYHATTVPGPRRDFAPHEQCVSKPAPNQRSTQLIVTRAVNDPRINPASRHDFEGMRSTRGDIQHDHRFLRHLSELDFRSRRQSMLLRNHEHCLCRRQGAPLVLRGNPNIESDDEIKLGAFDSRKQHPEIAGAILDLNSRELISEEDEQPWKYQAAKGTDQSQPDRSCHSRMIAPDGCPQLCPIGDNAPGYRQYCQSV